MYPGSKNPNWRGGQVQCVCKECGALYFVTPALKEKTKYCSRSCLGKASSRKNWEGHVATTRIRKTKRWKPREAPGAHTRLVVAKGCGHLTAKGRIYCHKCSQKGRGLVPFLCPICGKNVWIQRAVVHKRITCSKKCYAVVQSEKQRGEKSHLWKGGITEKNRLLRNSKQTDDWRRNVFKRDGYRCVKCFATGKLTADHILPWSLFPEKRFDIENGRTLCWPCHAKIGLNPGRMTKQQQMKLVRDASHGLPGV